MGPKFIFEKILLFENAEVVFCVTYSALLLLLDKTSETLKESSPLNVHKVYEVNSYSMYGLFYSETLIRQSL